MTGGTLGNGTYYMTAHTIYEESNPTLKMRKDELLATRLHGELDHVSVLHPLQSRSERLHEAVAADVCRGAARIDSGRLTCSSALVPAEGIHITAFREASASSRMPLEARRAVTRYEDAARLGAVLPDLPYFDHYAEEVLRYAAHFTPRENRWGAVVHEEAAVPIVYALVAAARRERSAELAALALGAGSHAAIDRALHPLVNALARRYAGGRTHDAAHREVEKFQSICFHEEYFGADRMGTDGIVRLVRVPFAELFAKAPVARAVNVAFASAIQAGPAPRDLARMGRGYEHHARLIGSPVGHLLASEPEKADARPKFLSGAWGSFGPLLADAIARSMDVLEPIWALFVADERDAESGVSELERALPRGSIDAPGLDVDVDVPFVVGPRVFAT